MEAMITTDAVKIIQSHQPTLDIKNTVEKLIKAIQQAMRNDDLDKARDYFGSFHKLIWENKDNLDVIKMICGRCKELCGQFCSVSNQVDPFLELRTILLLKLFQHPTVVANFDEFSDSARALIDLYESCIKAEHFYLAKMLIVTVGKLRNETSYNINILSDTMTALLDQQLVDLMTKLFQDAVKANDVEKVNERTELYIQLFAEYIKANDVKKVNECTELFIQLFAEYKNKGYSSKIITIHSMCAQFRGEFNRAEINSSITRLTAAALLQLTSLAITRDSVIEVSKHVPMLIAYHEELIKAGEFKLAETITDSLAEYQKNCVSANVKDVLTGAIEQMNTLDFAHWLQTLDNDPKGIKFQVSDAPGSDVLVSKSLFHSVEIRSVDYKNKRTVQLLIEKLNEFGMAIKKGLYNEAQDCDATLRSLFSKCLDVGHWESAMLIIDGIERIEKDLPTYSEEAVNMFTSSIRDTKEWLSKTSISAL